MKRRRAITDRIKFAPSASSKVPVTPSSSLLRLPAPPWSSKPSPRSSWATLSSTWRSFAEHSTSSVLLRTLERARDDPPHRRAPGVSRHGLYGQEIQ